MNRTDFIRKSLLGGSLLASVPSIAKELVTNDIDELQPMNVVGFNHIPAEPEATGENFVIHKAESRGGADHGWLKTRHSFSFASWYNPQRMNFGALRVLNDDIIAGGTGFSTHPHDNMEIISIPLSGGLKHKDSMGNEHVISENEIQVMSAGSGITHSEYNNNVSKEARFLQIWLFPNKKNVTPRYDQIKISAANRKNKFDQILSPSKNDEGVWIHQNAWFHLADLDAGKKIPYSMKNPNNGLYVFVLDGKFQADEHTLNSRDGLGIWAIKDLNFKAEKRSSLLLMEVPMSL